MKTRKPRLQFLPATCLINSVHTARCCGPREAHLSAEEERQNCAKRVAPHTHSHPKVTCPPDTLHQPSPSIPHRAYSSQARQISLEVSTTVQSPEAMEKVQSAVGSFNSDLALKVSDALGLPTPFHFSGDGSGGWGWDPKMGSEKLLPNPYL